MLKFDSMPEIKLSFSLSAVKHDRLYYLYHSLTPVLFQKTLFYLQQQAELLTNNSYCLSEDSKQASTSKTWKIFAQPFPLSLSFYSYRTQCFQLSVKIFVCVCVCDFLAFSAFKLCVIMKFNSFSWVVETTGTTFRNWNFTPDKMWNISTIFARINSRHLFAARRKCVTSPKYLWNLRFRWG